jgi:hypothetical protein
MKAHKTVPVIVRGQSVEIDKGIRGLVVLMNEIPGVETFNSCEGGDSGHAYVQFGGEGAFPLLPQLAQGILKEEKSWKRNHRHVCHGCKGMSVSLEIHGSGIVLRWMPYDYRRVLKIVKSLKMPT